MRIQSTIFPPFAIGGMRSFRIFNAVVLIGGLRPLQKTSLVNQRRGTRYIGSGMRTEMTVRTNWISQEKILDKYDSSGCVNENGGKRNNRGRAT